MADASYKQSLILIERYQNKVSAKAHEILNKYDPLLLKAKGEEKTAMETQANQEISNMVEKETADTLGKVLFQLSLIMKNSYARSDA